MDDDTLQQLVGSAIAYVSLHPRSEAEIRTYLAKRASRLHMPDTVILEALARLTELRYVDDMAYARMFVESRMRSRPKGERLIRLELRKKGVQNSIIEAICQELFLKDKNETTESELAKKVLMKKWRLWEKLPIFEKKRKVYQYLSLRGFSSSTIHGVIDELL